MTALATPHPEAARVGYDEDFALWAQQQAALLRALGDSRIDYENIAEELESMGRSESREIRSRLAVLLAYLLKWEYQPLQRSRSWRGSIVEARAEIAEILQESPSLCRRPAEVLDLAYRVGRDKAGIETGMGAKVIPRNCPYRVEDILNDTFYPGPATPAFDD
jgi:hypothetical protein